MGERKEGRLRWHHHGIKNQQRVHSVMGYFSLVIELGGLVGVEVRIRVRVRVSVRFFKSFIYCSFFVPYIVVGSY